MISLIRQQQKHDCGVACTAMLLGISYQEARELFIVHNLHKRKFPFSSQVGQLKAVLESTCNGIKRQVFKDWQSLITPCIAKTLVTSRGWHWVVIDRHPAYGLYVLDPWPEAPAISYEFPPLDQTSIHLDWYTPDGSCLHF